MGTYLLLLLSRAPCQFSPRAGLDTFAQSSEYALNLAIGGRHEGLSFGLAMRFVDRALFCQYC